MKTRIASILDKKRKRAGVAIVCAVLVFTMGTSVVLAAEEPPMPEQIETPIARNIDLPDNVVTDNTKYAPSESETPQVRQQAYAPEASGVVQNEVYAPPQVQQQANEAVQVSVPKPTEVAQPTAQPTATVKPKPTIKHPPRDYEYEKSIKQYEKYGITYTWNEERGYYMHYFKGKKIRRKDDFAINYRGAMYLPSRGKSDTINKHYEKELNNFPQDWDWGPKLDVGVIDAIGGEIPDNSWVWLYYIRDNNQKFRGIGIVKSIASDGRINPPPGYIPYK